MANTVAGNVLTNDTDVDATGSLVVSGVGGSAANVGMSVQGTYGTLTIVADGAFTYSLNNDLASVQNLLADQVVADVFEYVASDGSATGSASLTIRVHGAVAPPVTRDDLYVIDENVALIVTSEEGVIANDLIVNANVFAAVLVQGPGHGSVMLNADGSFRYNPDSGFVGIDSFNYVLADSTVHSNIATVFIRVLTVNDVTGP